MHKNLLIVFIILLFNLPAFSQTFRTENQATYHELPQIKTPYINGIDPYEQEDYSKYLSSPYPLFRASSKYYFKKAEIKEGYYLLTPRFEQGYDVIVFKQKGRAVHFIPAYETQKINPETFYPKKEPPKPKKPLWKKVLGFPWEVIKWPFRKLFGKKVIPQELPRAYMETYEIDKEFFGVDFYYEDTLYKLMLRNAPEQI